MSRDARWTHLLNSAFHLDEVQGRGASERTCAVRESLESALELFPGSDPLEDFEGYAVRRLLLSVRRALEPDAVAPAAAAAVAPAQPKTAPAPPVPKAAPPASPQPKNLRRRRR